MTEGAKPTNLAIIVGSSGSCRLRPYAGRILAEAPTPSPPALLRALGPWGLTALMVNGTIGSGILGLPGRLYALTGVWSLLVCLAAGALTFLIAASFAAAGSRFARTGGAYLFALTAFGRPVAGITGALAVLNNHVGYAAVANLLLTYAAPLLPGIDAGAHRTLALAAITVSLATLAYRGVRLSAAAHMAFTTVKFALLLGFVALALPTLLRHGIPAAGPPPPANWAPSLVLMLFALLGLEAVVVGGGEMRNPARDIPLAMGAGLCLIVMIYLAVLLASMAAVPDLAHSVRPVYDGAQALGGKLAGTGVAAGSCLAMLGVLFVLVFTAPRIVFAMAENRQLPGRLTALHPRFRTPRVAILVLAASLFGAACASSFLFALQLSVLVRLLMYAVTAAAAITLRGRGFSETEHPLNLPGGRLIPAITVLLCLALAARIALGMTG